LRAFALASLAAVAHGAKLAAEGKCAEMDSVACLARGAYRTRRNQVRVPVSTFLVTLKWDFPTTIQVQRPGG